MDLRIVFIFLTALVLGLRHGIDWDHIAAISDITGSGSTGKKNFIYAFIYALGHASIIIFLGGLSVFVGISLPLWVDKVMEPVVGATLIFLGGWLIFSILLHGKEFKMKSRWMILFSLANKFSAYIHKKIAREHKLPHFHYPESFSAKTAFFIGMIHGIGAETPTQVVIFLTAARIKGAYVGSAVLFLFVIGLIISNSVIASVSLLGYGMANKNPLIYVILGTLGGIFSLVVGTIFLFGHSSLLPALIGG